MTRNSLILGAFAFAIAFSPTFAAHEESRVLTWQSLQKDGKPLSGQLQPTDAEGRQGLRISNVGTTPTQFPIVVFNRLSPKANHFALEGQIRYQNVQGNACLEMWTVLPDGRRFFTRTLGEAGPLQKITGTSDWRPFSLPFDLSGQFPDHVTLEVNAFMPGQGIMDIGPLRIVNLSPETFQKRNIWWPDQTGGWIGGALGMAIGLLMASVAFLARRGAPRKLIMAILIFVFTLGVICAVAGIAAAVDYQPFAVCYPLLLAGVLAMVLTSVAYIRLRRHLRELELRKMQALDTQ